MKKGMAVAGLLFCSSALAEQNPIDHALEQCLNGASTTVAMVSCYDRASQAWDSEMNTQYGQLMKRLTSESKNKVRDAQRQWLAYRDSWQSASAAYFNSTQGTLAQISLAAQRVDLVRNQALLLRSMNKGSCADGGDC